MEYGRDVAQYQLMYAIVAPTPGRQWRAEVRGPLREPDARPLSHLNHRVRQEPHLALQEKVLRELPSVPIRFAETAAS
jgi:hypothetical protein